MHAHRTLLLAVAAAFPSAAQAITCQEVLALLDSDIPPETILDEIQKSPERPTEADFRCLGEANAPKVVMDAVWARVQPDTAPRPADVPLASPTPLPDAKGALPWGRLLTNSAVTGTGLAMAGGAIYNYLQAREAYADYLAVSDPQVSEDLLLAEVRPRSMLAGVEAGTAVLLVGTGTVLWLTTDHLDELAEGRNAGRYVLDSALTGGGAATLFAAGFNLFQARNAYDDYLAEADPVLAEALLENEVRPRQNVAIAEGIVGVVGLGAGLWLFGTSGSFHFTAAPNGVGLSTTW